MISRKQERILKKLSALAGSDTRISLITNTREERLSGTIQRCEGDLMGDQSSSSAADNPEPNSKLASEVPLWIYLKRDNRQKLIKLCYCEIVGLEEVKEE